MFLKNCITMIILWNYQHNTWLSPSISTKKSLNKQSIYVVYIFSKYGCFWFVSKKSTRHPKTGIDRFFSKLKKNGLAGFPKSYVASYVDYFFILQLIKIYLLVILQKKKYIHIFHSDKYLVHIVQFIQLSIIVEV